MNFNYSDACCVDFDALQMLVVAELGAIATDDENVEVWHRLSALRLLGEACGLLGAEPEAVF